MVHFNIKGRKTYDIPKSTCFPYLLDDIRYDYAARIVTGTGSERQHFSIYIYHFLTVISHLKMHKMQLNC